MPGIFYAEPDAWLKSRWSAWPGDHTAWWSWIFHFHFPLLQTGLAPAAFDTSHIHRHPRPTVWLYLWFCWKKWTRSPTRDSLVKFASRSHITRRSPFACPPGWCKQNIFDENENLTSSQLTNISRWNGSLNLQTHPMTIYDPDPYGRWQFHDLDLLEVIRLLICIDFQFLSPVIELSLTNTIPMTIRTNC